MEERMIDDEYGRGIRLKKTKDGYVDVTDGLTEREDAELQENGEVEEEIAFEFPVLDTDEDDEDLVGLTPKQALELRKKKAEAAAKRRAEYERLCAEGNVLLEEKNYAEAEKTFEKALEQDEPATEASVGYWRAKTADFSQPDELIGEYVDAGIESLEYDLGYDAVEIIKKEYRPVFERRAKELAEEEAPLAEEVESKQANRRAILKARVKKSALLFIAVTLPLVALTAFAVIFGLKNFSTRDNAYVTVTIVFAAAAVVVFFLFVFITNKFINALRMYRKNENLAETEAGERLVSIRYYKELYDALLATATAEERADE